MKDKVVLITGSAAGIGKSTAKLFAGQGSKVIVSDIQEEEGSKTVSEIEDLGGQAIFIKCDVADKQEVKELVEKSIEKYGRLDFGVNNAGIEGENEKTANCTEGNWDRIMDINLKGAWLCMKFEIEQMLKQGSGAIVNVSSVAGLVGFAGTPAYTASKHGMLGLTKTAALDYATSGIRVNAVCPAVIRTPMIDRVTKEDNEALKSFESMHPVGRLGEPKEVAEAIYWLCSDKASFITGAAFPIDGGFTSR